MSFQKIHSLKKALEHLYLFAGSWAISIVVGMMIGIYVTRPAREKGGRIALTITGMAQAVPSIAVIALVFIFMGIGAAPAIFALFLYSIVPITLCYSNYLLRNKKCRHNKLRNRYYSVSNKNFTEQYILCNLASLLLEENSFQVVERFGLSSLVARQALLTGQIDLYADYTGTAWVTYLGQEELIADPDELLQKESLGLID